MKVKRYKDGTFRSVSMGVGRTPRRLFLSVARLNSSTRRLSPTIVDVERPAEYTVHFSLAWKGWKNRPYPAPASAGVR